MSDCNGNCGGGCKCKLKIGDRVSISISKFAENFSNLMTAMPASSVKDDREHWVKLFRLLTYGFRPWILELDIPGETITIGDWYRDSSDEVWTISLQALETILV